MVTRRQFTAGLGSLAFAGLATSLTGCGQLHPKNTYHRKMATIDGYGPLIPDPDGILSLPEGFSYHIISARGDKMNDGLLVPDRADGMGCIPLEGDRVALVRNHELDKRHLRGSSPVIESDNVYDRSGSGKALPGGTSTIVYDVAEKRRVEEYLSLSGTLRNCSGGITPWGSWLTCEESVTTPDDGVSKYHGYVFEVPATQKGLVKPEPLVALGRFLHEAAAVDPRTGIVYLTEDLGDGLLYRFVPKVYGNLSAGGQLQALMVKRTPQFDTRNWSNNNMPLGQSFDVEWVDLDNPESPNDDLRLRGYQAGAALFARGEGIHWGENELYFCCTNGGKSQLGQVMRYTPSLEEGKPGEANAPGKLDLFVESTDSNVYNFGDNLTVAPNGHLIICEDQYTTIVDNHLRGVTPEGDIYSFARLELQTELAGACFSPDGKTLFVNVYSPTKTLAITGPWDNFSVNKRV